MALFSVLRCLVLLFGTSCVPLLAVAGRSTAIVAHPCPFEADLPDGSIDPAALANRAVHELFYSGRIAEALACHRLALRHLPDAMGSLDFVKSIRENAQNLEDLLGPRRPGFPRVYHNVVGRDVALVRYGGGFKQAAIGSVPTSLHRSSLTALNPS